MEKAEYNKRYRSSGKGEVSRKRYLAIKKEIIRLAKDRPCMDCGIRYPTAVMDFDHVRGIKSFGVSQGVNRGVDVLLTEISKCDVVCSNCHRMRTHPRST